MTSGEASSRSTIRTLATSLSDRATALGTVVVAHRARLLGVGLLLMVGVGSLARWVHRSVEHSVRRQVSAQLSVTLEAALGGFMSELESARRTAETASRSTELVEVLAECLSDDAFGTQRPDLRYKLEELLRPHMAVGRFSKVQVLDADGKPWIAFPSTGRLSEMPRLPGPLFGPKEPRLILPEAYGVEPHVVVPVLRGQRPLGGLSFELPMSSFTRILRAARAGTSGETYAFDSAGRLLSESRFTDELRELGLIEREHTTAVLALSLRDPGGDLTQGHVLTGHDDWPLTQLVSAVLARHAAVDVEGYRDYRGVLVVGAGKWLSQYGLGVASEVDASEAFGALAELDRIFLWLVGALMILAILALSFAVASTRLSRRVLRAESVAAKFGQYVLDRKVGEGGMGAVYLAEHALLRRPAAIKLLRPERITPDAVARFEREVLITSRLSHPNTVAIYDHGRTENGAIYYVMEYLEGLDLQSLVERLGPLSPARVVHLLRQLCGSLTEAHAMGLVHRDLKPANLMVCTRGGIADTLKVLDFGVVKSTKFNQVGLTASKILLGTPMYMAPEMFDSAEQASVQSDLYALGAVAYFLLTGLTVFDAESNAELCMAHLTKTPEPLSARLGAEVDPQLDAVTRACLAKKREARPKSAMSVCAMLERSALAHGWSNLDAETWWASNASQIASIKAREAGAFAPITKDLHTIRPVV